MSLCRPNDFLHRLCEITLLGYHPIVFNQLTIISNIQIPSIPLYSLRIPLILGGTNYQLKHLPATLPESSKTLNKFSEFQTKKDRPPLVNSKPNSLDQTKKQATSHPLPIAKKHDGSAPEDSNLLIDDEGND